MAKIMTAQGIERKSFFAAKAAKKIEAESPVPRVAGNAPQKAVFYLFLPFFYNKVK
ncbi:MAG: hypothetical protein FWG35_07070 [Spirochaetaceae bacterium]|nr:hypothetical protein [Spirochaetaceae bacterium]